MGRSERLASRSSFQLCCAALQTPPQPAFIGKLARPTVQRYVIGLALVLAAPSLATGLVLDDFVLGIKAGPNLRVRGLPVQPPWLFTFTTGNAEKNHALMSEGVLLPWWTEPLHRNAFFRPLSALSHVLDFRLWPETPALMHLQSLGLFAVLLFALATTYRQIEPSALLGGVGLLLYAIDDAHGATLAWISNRNALISAACALPALTYHARAVAGGDRAARLWAPFWLGLGLCAGETALCLFGYLAAYALCLDRRRWLQRALSLAPYTLLLLGHRAIYRVLGFGSFGSAAYHDPLHEPLAFIATLAFNLPVLLSAELFAPIADLAFFGDVTLRPWLWLWALASLGLVAWLCRRLLARDRHARFWATGMLLASVPVSASLPGERLLLAVGFGAAPLLARLLLAAVENAQSSPMRTDEQRPAGGAGAAFERHALGLLAGLHLLVAPVGLPIRSYFSFAPLAKACDRLDRGLPRTPDVRDKTAIVLNAPVDVMISYLQAARALRDVPRPEHLYWLFSASSPTRVTRRDAHTLRVTQQAGFLHRPEETHYRADLRGLAPGSRVLLPELAASVVDVMPDGRPHQVDFRFEAPLEASRYLFRSFESGELRSWQLPAPGAGSDFPAQDFFRLMAAEVLRWRS
jgi:hypothetical protein